LFGPIILVVVLACPPCAVFNFFGGIISSFLIDLAPVPAVAAATTAMVEGTTMDTPSTNEPVLSDVSSAAPASKPEADTSPRSKKLDHSATEVENVNEKTSAGTVKEVTETVAAEQVETGQPTVKDADSAGDASESTKTAEPRETPRPVKRDSLGADKTSDPSHRGNGGRAATEGPAGGRAATAGSSSSADSSSTAGASSGGGSSDKDAGGSE
jgi:hypothetical protein